MHEDRFVDFVQMCALVFSLNRSINWWWCWRKCRRKWRTWGRGWRYWSCHQQRMRFWQAHRWIIILEWGHFIKVRLIFDSCHSLVAISFDLCPDDVHSKCCLASQERWMVIRTSIRSSDASGESCRKMQHIVFGWERDITNEDKIYKWTLLITHRRG